MVPGVPRYHTPQCLLIRYMGDGDLEKMTLGAAREAGCSPCRACLPDQPDVTPELGPPEPERQAEAVLDMLPRRLGLRTRTRSTRTRSASRRTGAPARNRPRAPLPAISPACSVRAAATCGSSADQRSRIRSVTCSPSFLRASATSRTNSRARPSRCSSGLTAVSMATVSPASVATAQPARGVRVTITSSGPRATGSSNPSTLTPNVPPASTAVAISAAGPAVSAAATAGVRAPNRRPSARKFGFTA